MGHGQVLHLVYLHVYHHPIPSDLLQFCVQGCYQHPISEREVQLYFVPKGYLYTLLDSHIFIQNYML